MKAVCIWSGITWLFERPSFLYMALIFLGMDDTSWISIRPAEVAQIIVPFCAHNELSGIERVLHSERNKLNSFKKETQNYNYFYWDFPFQKEQCHFALAVMICFLPALQNFILQIRRQHHQMKHHLYLKFCKTSSCCTLIPIICVL